MTRQTDGSRSQPAKSASKILEIQDLLDQLNRRLGKGLAHRQRKLLEVLLGENSFLPVPGLLVATATGKPPRGPAPNENTNPRGKLLEVVSSTRARLDELGEGAGFEIVLEKDGSYRADRARLEARLGSHVPKAGKLEERIFAPGAAEHSPALVLLGAGALAFARLEAGQIAHFLTGEGSVFVFFAPEEKWDAVRLWLLLDKVCGGNDPARLVLVAAPLAGLVPGTYGVRQNGCDCEGFIVQQRRGGLRGPRPAAELAEWEGGDPARRCLLSRLDSATVPEPRRLGCFRIAAEIPDAEASGILAEIARMKSELRPRPSAVAATP